MGVDRLGDARRPRRKTPVALRAVAVELDVGQVQGQAPGGADGLLRGRDVTGHTQVTAVHVQRVRHAELVYGAAQDLDHGARCDVRVVGVGLVEVERALVEFEGADPARVHDLDGQGLGGLEGPGHVVVDDRLLGLLGHEAQEEIVAPEHDIGALVDDGGVGHLHVGLAGVGGRHGGLEAGRIAHLDIAIAGGEGGRHDITRAGAGDAGARDGVVRMVLGQQDPSEGHLAPADVGVDVDGPGHHHLAGEVMLVGDGLAVQRRGHDAPVADIEIARLAIDAVGGIVERTACEARQHRLERSIYNPWPMAARHCATLGSPESRSRRSGRDTTLSRRTNWPA